MRTIVFTIGAKPPLDDGAAVVEREISGAHKYYNALIEIERGHLVAKEAIRQQFLPGMESATKAIADAESAMEAIRGEIRKRNAAAQKRTATADDKAAVKAAIATLTDARGQRKAILASVHTRTMRSRNRLRRAAESVIASPGHRVK